MLEGILRVYANPDRPNEVSQRGMVGTAGVEHVIVRSTRKKDFEVLQPIDIEPDAMYAQKLVPTWDATYPHETRPTPSSRTP